MKSHIETLCVVGIVLLGLLMHQQMRKRIERLEDRFTRIDEREIIRASATNAFITNSITISNASEKTITVTFPSPLQAKEDKP